MHHLLRKLTITAALAAFGGPATAAIYYLAPGGSDDNPGSAALPWRTLAKANQTLTAGDTLLLRAGTWEERIVPARSGSKGAPITYSAYPGESVRVRGDGAGSVVSLSGREYIVLDGLDIRFGRLPKGDVYDIYVSGGGYHVLRNLTIVNSDDYVRQRADGYRETGIHIVNGSVGNEVTYSRVHGMSLHAVNVGGASRNTRIHHNDLTGNAMNSVTIGSSKGVVQGTLIEYNLLGDSAISDGVQTNPNYDLPAEQMEKDTSSRGVIVRHNIIRNAGENGIDLKGAAHWVIEGNTIYGASGNNDGGTKMGDNRFGGYAIHKGSATSSRDVIIRHNVLFDNFGGTIVLEGYKVYNNTFVNNNRDYQGPNSDYADGYKTFPAWLSDWGSGGVSVINNIIGDHYHDTNLRAAAGQEVDYNLYFNGWRPSAFSGNVGGRWQDMAFDAWRAWLRTSGVAGAEAHSVLVRDPLLARPVGRVSGAHARVEFAPTAGSRAVDAGRVLTTASNSGNGSRTLKVGDARFFCDGYGVSAGDAIRIGDHAPVRIVAIDYASHTLTLDTAVTWASGAGVSLPYRGSAPDIGAIELEGAPMQTPPAVPSGVGVEMEGVQGDV